MSIPGIGPRTSEALIAWIDQPQRFYKKGSLANYFGLTPSQDSSAGKARFGRITKQGPSLIRKLLVEATWQVIRRVDSVRDFFIRIQRNHKNRRKIAVVATVHHLLKIMHAMLLNQTPFRLEQQTA